MTEDDLIVDALPKPMAVIAAGPIVRRGNPAFAALIGAPVGDCERMTRLLRDSATLSPALGKALGKLRTVGWSSGFRWNPSAADGHVFDVQVTRIAHDDFAVVFDEVSNYLRIEDIQSRARAYLEAVINHLNLGVIVLDGEFNTTFFNDDQAALFRRLGVERSLFEIIGSPIDGTYPIFTRAEWEGIYSRVIRAGETSTWSKLGYPRLAPTSYFLVTVVPLATRQDRLPGAICMTEDVTKTVALERELLHKERLALVGQMTIALNHEINNPLTAILGTAESLTFGQDLGPEVSARVETIRVNALRIVDVTRKLREIEDIHLTEYIQGGPLMLDIHAHAK